MQRTDCPQLRTVQSRYAKSGRGAAHDDAIAAGRVSHSNSTVRFEQADLPPVVNFLVASDLERCCTERCCERDFPDLAMYSVSWDSFSKPSACKSTTVIAKKQQTATAKCKGNKQCNCPSL